MSDKNFGVGIFLNKKLVSLGLQETNNFFFRPYMHCSIKKIFNGFTWLCC